MKKWAAILGGAALIAGVVTIAGVIEIAAGIAQVLFGLLLIAALVLAVGAFKSARKNR